MIVLSPKFAGAVRLAPELFGGDALVARRGMTLLSPEDPPREAQRESARAIVLLALGFLVQLVGYLVDGGWWLLLLAGAVIVTAYIGGRLVGDTVAMSWLHRRARSGAAPDASSARSS